MSLSVMALLAAAGFAAGLVNAIAGGGAFFTFGALVAAGLPTLIANATSAVALTPGNVAIVFAYRAEVRKYFRDIVAFAAIGIAGAVAGSLILIELGDSGFRPMVPWLLLVATLLFAFSSRIRDIIAPWSDRGSKGAVVLAYAIMSAVAVYGGFFGAGMGIVMLAALAILEGGDFH